MSVHSFKNRRERLLRQIKPLNLRIARPEPRILMPHEAMRVMLDLLHGVGQRQLAAQHRAQLRIAQARHRRAVPIVFGRKTRTSSSQPRSIISSTRASVRRYSSARGSVRPIALTANGGGLHLAQLAEALARLAIHFQRADGAPHVARIDLQRGGRIDLLQLGVQVRARSVFQLGAQVRDSAALQGSSGRRSRRECISRCRRRTAVVCLERRSHSMAA